METTDSIPDFTHWKHGDEPIIERSGIQYPVGMSPQKAGGLLVKCAVKSKFKAGEKSSGKAPGPRIKSPSVKTK